MNIQKTDAFHSATQKYITSGFPEWMIKQCLTPNEEGEFVLDSERLSNLLFVKNRDPFQGERAVED